MKENEYGIKRELDLPFNETIKKVIEELKKEDFGVMTEIDVKATLKNKLDKDYRNYVILGACNPKLAYEMLQEEADIGLLLPCNVVVYDSEETGKTVVAAIDPVAILKITERADLVEVAVLVKEKLNSVIKSL